jgi:uncharacterized membrane protein YqjE
VSATRDRFASAAGDATQPIDPDQSLADLVGRMTSDVGQLVSTQLELAKVEIKEEVARAGKGVGMVAGGGLAAHMAVLLISFALAYGLATVIDSLGWAFFFVGLLWAIAATVLALKGKEQISTATPVAEQTLETLKEDVEWARQQKS